CRDATTVTAGYRGSRRHFPLPSFGARIFDQGSAFWFSLSLRFRSIIFLYCLSTASACCFLSLSISSNGSISLLWANAGAVSVPSIKAVTASFFMAIYPGIDLRLSWREERLNYGEILHKRL